jgi:N-acyl-D-amino-acid deacylase
VNRRDFVRFSLAGAAGVLLPRRLSAQPLFDLVLEGGTLVDGLGGAPFRGELAIVGDRIAAVGRGADDPTPGARPRPRLAEFARRVVDVQGKIVCPGFVDLHSHSDWTLLDCPTADSRIRQGITTEITGNCGSSAAPETVDGVERDVAAWFRELEAKRIAVNVALLVGQGNLRLRAMGPERGAQSGLAEATERARMAAELEAAMDAGAIGLSTGLEYVPGIFTPVNELEELARVVARRGGLYASHLRNEESQVLAAVDEAIAIARRTGVRTQMSHFKVVGRSLWPLQAEALAKLEQARAEGLDVAADVYPYTAYSTGLSILVPAWAREGGSAAMFARLADPARRAEIRAAVVTYVATDPGDFDLVVISSVGETGRADAVGRSVARIAAGDGVEPAEALLRLLEGSKDDVSFVGFGMSEENVAKVLAHPLVAFGSDGYALRAEDEDADRPHPRSYGAAARVLAHYCRDRKAIDLQTAVRKLTAFPADRAGLADRGRLLPGCFADVVVFDLEQLADRATYDEPKRYAAGLERVFVNGVAVVENGELTGERAGRVLRRGARA